MSGIPFDSINIEELSKLLISQEYDDSFDSVALGKILNTTNLTGTIYDKLKKKIIYYTDNFESYNLTNQKYIDIDLSFYASERMKEYMFIYDFISEYFRNLAEISKAKNVIDNKSLYSHEFDIKVRYKTIDENIINIKNDDNADNYYNIKFNLSTNGDKTNIYELALPTSADNRNQDNDLFNDLIIKSDNNYFDFHPDNIDYYSLLTISYNAKFMKLLLNYNIALAIHKYFNIYADTDADADNNNESFLKVQEINSIIFVFSKLFNNFNNIINENNNESFLKVIKNTKQKKFNKDKKIMKKIEQKKKQILLSQDDEEKEKLEGEIEELLDKRYITKTEFRVNKAIKYNQNFDDIDKKIKNNNVKINNIDNVINNDRQYLNNVSIIIYVATLLLIILFVTLSLFSVIGGSNINISIPITFIIISLILYIFIYNYIGNKKNIYTKTYKKPNILNKIYNSFGFELFETFEDISGDYDDYESETLTAFITRKSSEDSLDSHIDVAMNYLKDENKDLLLYLDRISALDGWEGIEPRDSLHIDRSVVAPSMKITVKQKNAAGQEVNILDHGSMTKTHYGAPIGSPIGFDKNPIAIVTTTSNQKVISFVYINNDTNTDAHTKYIFKTPISLQVEATVVGGGSHGGAQSSEEGGGGGGGGGALIHQSLDLEPGEYEIGVGRGGSSMNTPSSYSYIKRKNDQTYYILAQGATFEPANNIQTSAGNIGFVSSATQGNCTRQPAPGCNIAEAENSVKNIMPPVSQGGKGGVNIPQDQDQPFKLTGTPDGGVLAPPLNTARDFVFNRDPADGKNGPESHPDLAAGGGGVYKCDGITSDDKKYFQYISSDVTDDDIYFKCIDEDSVAREGGSGGGGGVIKVGGGGGGTDGMDALDSTGSGGGGGINRGGKGGSGLVKLAYTISIVEQAKDVYNERGKKNLVNAIHDVVTIFSRDRLEKVRQERITIEGKLLNLSEEWRLKYKELVGPGTGYYDKIGAVEDSMMSANGAVAVLQTQLEGAEETAVAAAAAAQAAYERLEEMKKADASVKNLTDAQSAFEAAEERNRLAGLAKDDANGKLNNANGRLSGLANEIAAIVQQAGTDKLAAAKAAESALIKEQEERSSKNTLATEYADKDNELNIMIAEAEAERDNAQRLLRKIISDIKHQRDLFNTKEEEWDNAIDEYKLKEMEKSYLISLKLALNHDITGGLSAAENEKREEFINDILTELTLSISDSYDIMSTRFFIRKVHRGVRIVSDDDREARRKRMEDLQSIKGYKDAYDTYAQNFEPFFVCEHFQTPATTGTDTIIDIEILPHPQLIEPYALTIKDEIITQIKDTGSKIRTSKYLRYITHYQEYSKLNGTGDNVCMDDQTEQCWQGVDAASTEINNTDILQNNRDEIANIINNFNELRKVEIDNETYYDIVHPLVKKEYRKYRNNENISNIYLKMSEGSNNIKLYDIRLKESIVNYIVTLCLLISIYVLVYKFNTNILIMILFIIIILYFTLMFLIHIYEIVNTKSDKNYWFVKDKTKL